VAPELPAVLAVDGGNSKTDVALVAADGSLLGTARGAGATGPSEAEVAAWLEELAGLIAQLQRQAGTSGQPAARHISACVANADLPDEVERLGAVLAARGWSQTTEARNDTFAVLRAGLDGTAAPGAPHWGVAVTCGAGINCVGVHPDGRTTGYLALGVISGQGRGRPGPADRTA